MDDRRKLIAEDNRRCMTPHPDDVAFLLYELAEAEATIATQAKEIERLRASISPDCCICGIPDDPVYGPKKRRFTDAEVSAAEAEIARRLRDDDQA